MIRLKKQKTVRFGRRRHPRDAFIGGSVAGVVMAIVALPQMACAAVQYFGGSGSTTLTATVYGTYVSGPFTSAFTSGNVIVFGATNTGTGNSVTVGGLTAVNDFTLSAGGTISNAGDEIVPIIVAAGKTLDLGSQSFATSTRAGYTFTGNTSGVLALAGGSFAGGFTLDSGVVVVRAGSAFGTKAPTINGGTLATDISGGRDLTGSFNGNITVGGNFTLGATAAVSPIASSGGGFTFANSLLLGAATRTITLGNSATHTFNASIVGSPGSGLTVTGSAIGNGTLALNAANTYAGPTTFNLTNINLGANGTFNSTTGTTLNRAAVTFAPSHAATMFNGLTLSNASSITTSTFVSGASLALGAITRNPGSTLNLTLPTSGSITTTTANTASTILGGYAVVGGTTWAVSNGSGTSAGGVTAYADANYSTNAQTASTTSNFNATATAAFTNNSINSLRFHTAADVTVTLPSGGFAIGSGGILVTPVVGSKASVITGGTSLTSGNGSDLIVTQNNTAGTLTIGTSIGNAGTTAIALTKSGSGSLIVTGANTYTGPTYINAGTLQVGNGGSTGSLGSGAITNNGALVFNRSGSLPVAAIRGTGSVAQSGPGKTIVTDSANSYAGTTAVNAGTLQVGEANSTTAALSATSAVTVSGTGTLAGYGAVNAAAVIGVNGGGTITAGTGSTTSDTPGTLTTGGQNWGSTGRYVWKTTSSSGTAGTTWDLLNMGTLVGVSGFTVQAKLGSDGAFTPPASGTTTYKIADTTNTSGIDVANLFTLDVTGLGVSADAGTFTLSFEPDSGGYDLNIVFTATPEPATAALFGMGMSGLLGGRRRVIRVATAKKR